MIKCITMIISVGTLLATNAIAGAMGQMNEANSTTWVASISGGPAWTDSKHSETFYLTTDVINTYDAKKTTDTLASGEIFLGGQTPFKRIFLMQMGIAFVATSNAQLKGDIWDDADPDLNNLDYSYQIRHTHVALKTKVLMTNWQSLEPYISASVGVGFNRSEDFTSRTKLVEVSPGPGFESKTTTAFTYTIGAGLQRTLTTNWHVNVGYEFTDWGNSSLSRTPVQTLNNGLNLNHFYTNSLQIGLTYTV